ncbi:hypothetical protein QOZ80_8BG0668040 [Eleusine coracana subsp. coracana]|nr:hypothetical protein QOZ80_8BG0668040 [Eleusine coracana subsp. coracana]
MAEALLLSVVRGVVGKAGDALVKRVTRMWGVDGDRERLERRLVYVQSLLADAEEKSETNDAVKAWMTALKAAAYKADDVLDDFQYEALRLEAQSRRSVTTKVLSFFTLQNRLVFRHKTSMELKNVLGKIEELVSEMKTYELEPRGEVPQVVYRQTHSALDESAEIFGRDDDIEQVMMMLLDQKDQRNVQGLLQRLPALKYLEIENCPDLQRRCRQGGEYFDLVSSIRDRDIPATPPIVKTFVTKAIHKKRALKKFLTSC